MGNVIGAIIGVIVFIGGVVLIGVSVEFPPPWLFIGFIGGILVVSAAIGLPVWILSKFDG